MADDNLPDDLLELLLKVDTPTVCNAVEIVQGRRGFNRFTRGTMQHSRPGAPPVLGYARTAKISGLAPPVEKPEAVQARRVEYYEHMAAGPSPSVAVIEDVDHPNCVGAWWGEVNTNVHKGLGLAGAVTNGVMRDLDAMADGFPVLAGSLGPSHLHVHLVEIGTPVSIMGMRVAEGELVHADRHGAAVIPADAVPGLKAAIEKSFANEAIVLEAARKPEFDIGRLKEAWAKLEAARK